MPGHMPRSRLPLSSEGRGHHDATKRFPCFGAADRASKMERGDSALRTLSSVALFERRDLELLGFVNQRMDPALVEDKRLAIMISSISSDGVSACLRASLAFGSSASGR